MQGKTTSQRPAGQRSRTAENRMPRLRFRRCWRQSHAAVADYAQLRTADSHRYRSSSSYSSQLTSDPRNAFLFLRHAETVGGFSPAMLAILERRIKGDKEMRAVSGGACPCCCKPILRARFTPYRHRASMSACFASNSCPTALERARKLQRRWRHLVLKRLQPIVRSVQFALAGGGVRMLIMHPEDRLGLTDGLGRTGGGIRTSQVHDE